MSVLTSPPSHDSMLLSPTPRSTVNRGRARARVDRCDLYEVLERSLVCHLGVVVDDVPLVLPTAFGVALDGPDPGGTIYLHGSVAARSLQAAASREICVTLTVLDGLVL